MVEPAHDNHSISFDDLKLSDAKDVLDLWSDQEAVKLTNWPHISTFEDCVARLERTLKYYENPVHFGVYAIRVPKDVFIGIIGADVVDEIVGSYEVWYDLKREFWNRGLAKSAFHRLLDLMRNSGRVKLATATAVTSNVASWRLLEGQGFKRTGIRPGGLTKHGQNLDLFSYMLEL